jgi:drug/metabolite transporter (DMT)-like permease
MLYVGIAASLLANLLYMIGIARVGPARAGMFIHLVPLYGALMSIEFLGERLGVHQALGMVAIMAGLAWSTKADSAGSGPTAASSSDAISPD